MFVKVPTYENIEVSESGVVRYCDTQEVLEGRRSNTKYLYFSVSQRKAKGKKTLTQHRALALAFIPNPENKPCVNHKNSDRTDNSLSNLEWVTYQENSTHAKHYGFVARGEDNGNSSYEEKQAHAVCKLLEGTLKVSEIAKMTDTSVKFVTHILYKNTWVQVSNNYTLRKVKPKMTEDIVHSICKLIVDGVSNAQIERRLQHLGVTRGIVLFIRNRKTFTHVSCNYNW